MPAAALFQPDPRAEDDTAPHRIRCLVIEDNAFDQKRMERLLKETGVPHEVAFCATVKDAEAILHSVAFDLLMVDYRLPDGNGISFLEDLRQSARQNARTPAVLFSGEEEEDLRTPGRSVGYCSVMTKHHLTAQRVALAVSLALDETT